MTFEEKENPAGVGTNDRIPAKAKELSPKFTTEQMIRAIGMVASITVEHPGWNEIIWHLREIREILIGGEH